MNEMVIKQFEGQQLRHSLDEQGKHWFVAKDICESLGIKNVSHAVKKIKKTNVRIVSNDMGAVSREFNCVNKSGMYALILQSRKPSAIRYQEWVTDEVLSEIHEKGFYSLTPVKELTPAERLMVLAESALENERRISSVAAQLTVVAAEAKQEDDTLTSDQISQLDRAMHERFLSFKIKNKKAYGLMKKAIKDRFFDIKGTRTYKEIKRRDFSEALLIIQNFKKPDYLT